MLKWDFILAQRQTAKATDAEAQTVSHQTLQHVELATSTDKVFEHGHQCKQFRPTSGIMFNKRCPVTYKTNCYF